MKQTLAPVLALALALCLLTTGCGEAGVVSPTPSSAAEPSPVSTPVSTSEPIHDTRPAVNLDLSTGSAGIGAVKLLAENEAGTAANAYRVTLAASNDEIAAGLVSGETDIAAVATDAAARLYHETGGGIQIAAVNTLGVLHILERGNTIRTIFGLKGKTVYAAGEGENPAYILEYLLAQNGLAAGKDVTLVWKTAEEISSLMLAGEAGVCMLPEPDATALVMASMSSSKADAQIRDVLDLSEEWEEVSPDSVPTMGCIVVRTSFAAEHPDVVNDFLNEYAASVDYVNSNPEEAAALVTQYGIAAEKAAVAQAIPQCNLVCVTGRDIMDEIQSYFEVLYTVDPAAIGGSIPDDGFYYFP